MKSALKVDTGAQALRGQVETLFFSSPRFSAGRLEVADGTKAMFAGQFCLREGDPVVLHGGWGRHAKYGRQFQAEWFEYDSAPPTDGLAQYLAHHPALKGIGPARARRIAEQFGAGFDQALARRSGEIASAAGVPLSTIETLAAEWTKVKAVRSALTILSAYGLTHHQVTTLVEKHGNGVVALLKDDPYRLVGEIKGMGFKKVDQIARQLGTPKGHRARIRAGIVNCVQEALDQGDCWVEYEDLIRRALTLLVMDSLDAETATQRELKGLIDRYELHCESLGGRFLVALPFMVRLERELAAVFGQGGADSPHAGKFPDAAGLLDELAPELNDDQRQAVLRALLRRISLISGGAGSGKTFTIRAIADLYEHAGLTVTLTAPTGKAAKRMEQLSGRPAQTIHRLLEYNGREFGRGADSPLECDVVIVDEVSMVDVPLAWRLFQAIDPEATAVVLVGDHNQLPPVGPGNILRDLIQARAVPLTILSRIVRQAGVLKENSIALLAGHVAKTSAPGPQGHPDWFLLGNLTDAAAARDHLLALFERALAEKLGFDLVRDVQVLTPTHKGPLGTQELNACLQRLIQKKLWGVDAPPIAPGRRPQFLLRDKVIQSRNNYDLGVMNGTMGVITEVQPGGGLRVRFEGQEGDTEIDAEARGDLQLAYALTIHRAQGSEFPCAIVIMHKSHAFMHHRSLFYTAVTRAQRAAIILGDPWGIRNCAAKCLVDQRKTFLSLLLAPWAEAD